MVMLASDLEDAVEELTDSEEFRSEAQRLFEEVDESRSVEDQVEWVSLRLQDLVLEESDEIPLPEISYQPLETLVREKFRNAVYQYYINQM